MAMRAHDDLGFVLAGAADYRVAVTHLEAALRAATTLGDAEGEVSALSRLSIVRANRLDFDAALAFGERALRSSDALHDEHAEADGDGCVEAGRAADRRLPDAGTAGRTARRDPPPERRPVDAAVRRGRGRVRGSRADAPGSLVRRARRVSGDQPTDRRHRQRADVPGDPRPRPSRPRRLRRGPRGGPAGIRPRPRVGARRVDRGGGGVARLDAGRAGRVRRGGGAARGRRRGGRTVGRRPPSRPVPRDGAWAAERLGERGRAVTLADRAAFILDRIRVRPPRAWVAGYDAYIGVARLRLAIGEPERAEELVSPIVVACRACAWSDGVVDGSLVLSGGGGPSR